MFFFFFFFWMTEWYSRHNPVGGGDGVYSKKDSFNSIDPTRTFRGSAALIKGDNTLYKRVMMTI